MVAELEAAASKGKKKPAAAAGAGAKSAKAAKHEVARRQLKTRQRAARVLTDRAIASYHKS